jgi:ParB-like nuclease domain
MAMLKIVDIKLDGGTQFRESINQDKVKEYKELMLEDVVFDPIHVVYDGTYYYLIDGFHRYFAIKAMSVKSIEARVTNGTLQDAIRMARRANNSHGMPRSIETKRRVVMSAINDPENEGMSAREIAKECVVSHPFVLNIMKGLQGGNVTTKPPKETKPSGNVTTPVEPKPPLTQDFAPSEEELEADQRAFEADIQAMNKLLEADDALATAHAEIKKLNLAYANLESRFNSLMREKDKAVELLQKAQRELDRIKKAKK